MAKNSIARTILLQKQAAIKLAAQKDRAHLLDFIKDLNTALNNDFKNTIDNMNKCLSLLENEAKPTEVLAQMKAIDKSIFSMVYNINDIFLQESLVDGSFMYSAGADNDYFKDESLNTDYNANEFDKKAESENPENFKPDESEEEENEREKAVGLVNEDVWNKYKKNNNYDKYNNNDDNDDEEDYADDDDDDDEELGYQKLF